MLMFWTYFTDVETSVWALAGSLFTSVTTICDLLVDGSLDWTTMKRSRELHVDASQRLKPVVNISPKAPTFS